MNCSCYALWSFWLLNRKNDAFHTNIHSSCHTLSKWLVSWLFRRFFKIAMSFMISSRKRRRICWVTSFDWSTIAWFETITTRCNEYSIVARTTWKFITSTRRQTMWNEWKIKFDINKSNSTFTWINCAKWYVTWLLKRMKFWKQCWIFQKRNFLSFRDWNYETISFEKTLNIISSKTNETNDRWTQTRDWFIVWWKSESFIIEKKRMTNTKSKHDDDWSIDFTNCWSRWCNDHENRTRAISSFWACVSEASTLRMSITFSSSMNTTATCLKEVKWSWLFDITKNTTSTTVSKWFIVFCRAKWTRCWFESFDWFVRRETRCMRFV